MKCPYCDIEIISGFLNCGNTVWNERKNESVHRMWRKKSMPCI